MVSGTVVHAHFSKGTEVEICSDDEGLRGAWYIATVLRSNSRRNKIFVEYQSLMDDEKGSKPLREFVDAVNVRPLPPRETNRSFELSDEVDAFHNDGWWEGVVTKVLENSKYLVYFRATKEEIVFGQSDLRLHREWFYGSWVPPMEQPPQQSTSSRLDTDQNRNSSELQEKFSKGTLVEVSSDEEGFDGAWFTAKIIKPIGEDKFIVEYQTLSTDDDTELLREEVDALHIRPLPPDTQVDSFRKLEEVDALFNDGWWLGVISKVLSGQRYEVYFRETNEELQFKHSDLRLHQDWIKGKWVRPSQVKLLNTSNSSSL